VWGYPGKNQKKVTIYLYGSLDKDIHMKIPEGFKMLEIFYDKPKSVYPIKLQNIYMGWSNLVECVIIVLVNAS
jgi:hypothetical protein